MVNVIKDERIVNVEKENLVVFKHNNEQHYTAEQARNVYVNFLSELKSKTAVLSKFTDIQKSAEEEYEKQLEQQTNIIKALCKEVSFNEILGWKKVQRLLNGKELKEQLKKLKQDIENIKQGLKIWECVEDLPETDYEKKLIKAGKI